MTRMGGAERGFISVALAFLALTWWGVVLAEIGILTLIHWLAPLIVVVASGLWRRRSRPRRRRHADGGLAVLALLLLIGSRLYFPVFDVRIEARDPGVYYLAGLQLARTGAINWVDPTVAEMDREERAYWFPTSAIQRGYDASRFMGFYMQSLDDARVQPQALPVLPVWIAAGAMLAGTAGAQAVTPLLAIAAAAAVFFFASRWRGPLAGTLAAVLLAGSFPQAWFARYVAAEVPAQLLTFIALYGLLQYRRMSLPAFAWMAAGGFGLLWLTKIETVLLVVPLTALLLADVAVRGIPRRDWANLWLPLGGLGVHALLHQRLFIWPYSLDVLWQWHLPPILVLLAPAAGVIGIGAAVMLLPRWRTSLGPTLESLRAGCGRAGTRLRYLLAAALAASFVWAYWVRPAPWYGDAPPGLLGQTWNDFNLVELGWAISPPLLLAALAGFMLLLLREPWSRGSGAILATGLPLIGLGIWNRQIWAWLPWAYRRWLPLLLPLVIVVGCWAMVWAASRAARGLADRRPRRRLAAAAALLLLAFGATVTVAHQWRWTMAYDAHQEMPGVAKWLREIGDAFEPGALLLFEPRANRGLTRLEAEMAIDHELHVLRLPGLTVDAERVRALLQRQERRGAPVYLVTTGHLDALLEPAARRHHGIHFESTRLRDLSSEVMVVEGKWPQPPTETTTVAVDAHIYRLLPRGRLTPLLGELDVGSWDDLYLSGPSLYEAEFDDSGRSYRWTRDRAEFALPGLGAFARTLIVRVDPTTPLSVSPQFMRVSLDGHHLGTVQLEEGWINYRFAIPPEWRPPEGGPPRLEIEIDPSFRPMNEFPGSADTRLMGVKVDKIGWQPLAPERRR